MIIRIECTNLKKMVMANMFGYLEEKLEGMIV